MEAFESMDKAGMKQFTLYPDGRIHCEDWTYPRALKNVFLNPEDDELIKALHEWTGEVIEERKKNSPAAKRRDFFAKLMFGEERYEHLLEENRPKVDAKIAEFTGIKD